ncbi:MAG: nucleotidyltransferase domain-containing protein [Chloroflexi bacterium]|nr:nucleotidyltransferase domain-containing protein [Chloroflexota bacterium]
MSDNQSGIQINLPLDEITAFCERWKILEFALFGSVLRDDFGSDSDIDVLVTFAPGSLRTLAAVTAMHNEIEAVLGRSVDLIDRQSIERSPNYLRRQAILGSLRTIYAA